MATFTVQFSSAETIVRTATVQVEAETAAEAGMQVAKRDRELNDLPWVVTDTEVEATEVSVWEGVVPPEDKYGADTVLEGFGRAFYSRKEEGCSC